MKIRSPNVSGWPARGCALVMLAMPALSLADSLSFPVLGYVPSADSASLLRIDGVPGAAMIRSRSGLATGFKLLSVSAGGHFAIGVDELNGAKLTIVTLEASVPDAAVFGGGDSTSVALSANGRWAAIYSEARRVIEIFNGLPATPAYAGSVSTGATQLPARALAISDEGAVVLATTDGASTELLWSASAGADVIAIPAVVSVVVFRPQSNEAFLVTNRQLYRMTPNSSTAEVRHYRHLTANASAAAFSRDGKRLFISDPLTKAIHIIDAAGASRVMSCACSPESMERLAADAVFWLKESGSGTVRILDADAPEPRVLMVPFQQPSN